MAVIVNDTFTTGSDQLLSAHTADVGGQWVLTQGTSTWTVYTTGVASPTALVTNTGNIYTSRPNPSVAEYDIQTQITAFVGIGSDDPIAIVARLTNTSNYYFALMYSASASLDKRIFKRVADIVTQIASAEGSLAVNDTYKFEIRNATKKLYRNTVEILSSTDNALTSAGSAGLAAGNLAVAGDDIAASWDLNNYSVDEVGGAAAASLLLPQRSRVERVALLS